MPATVSADAPSVPPLIWPITTTLVVSAFLLMAYQMYEGAVFVLIVFIGPLLSFFSPETLPDPDYVPTGMGCLTTLPAFAAMIWCGWQRGSRRGLLLVGVPTAVMICMALIVLLVLPTFASTASTPRPSRSLSLADPFADMTHVNWVVAALFVGCAVVTLLLRRRARHTENGSAA